MKMRKKIFTILLITTIFFTVIINYKVDATEQAELDYPVNVDFNSQEKIMKYDAITNETTEVDMEELRAVISSKYNVRNSNEYVLDAYSPYMESSSANTMIQPLATGMDIVIDTSIRPYITTCKITYSGGDLGTASIVGPNVGLTAAHCVFDKDNNNAVYKNWTIYPGYNEKISGDTKYYGTPCGWSQVYYSSNWMSEHNYKDDWAICVLQSDVGNQVGYYRTKSIS